MIDAYPRIALAMTTLDLVKYGGLCILGERWVTHFLMKNLERSGNQNKKTRFAGLFFLAGLRPVLPLGQCPPSNC